MFKVRRRLPIVAIIVVIVVVVRVVGMWWRFLCGSGMGTATCSAAGHIASSRRGLHNVCRV